MTQVLEIVRENFAPKLTELILTLNHGFWVDNTNLEWDTSAALTPLEAVLSGWSVYETTVFNDRRFSRDFVLCSANRVYEST